MRYRVESRVTISINTILQTLPCFEQFHPSFEHQVRDANTLGQPVGNLDAIWELDGNRGDAATSQGRLFHDVVMDGTSAAYRRLF